MANKGPPPSPASTRRARGALGSLPLHCDAAKRQRTTPCTLWQSTSTHFPSLRIFLSHYFSLIISRINPFLRLDYLARSWSVGFYLFLCWPFSAETRPDPTQLAESPPPAMTRSMPALRSPLFHLHRLSIQSQSQSRGVFIRGSAYPWLQV